MTVEADRPARMPAQRAAIDATAGARHYLPEHRSGHLARVDRFSVFVDEDRYVPDIQIAIDEGYYENGERDLIRTFLGPDDRVIEVGAGIGVTAMTAASIVGENNVVTFDAHSRILSDARDNFRRNGFLSLEARAGVLRNRRLFAPNSLTNFYIDTAFWVSRLGATATTPGITKVVQAPVYCLEDEIAAIKANVLLCDIEGGEVELLSHADLSGIRLMIVETHPWLAGQAAIDAMARKIMMEGFSIDLGKPEHHIAVFRR
jgi:FkbM family methyltransferase